MNHSLFLNPIMLVIPFLLALTACQSGSSSNKSLASKAQPEINITSASGDEKNTGIDHLVFNVTLSHAYDEEIRMDFHTVDSSATAGQDYQETQETLIIPAGTTSSTILVPVIGDTDVEPNESFKLILNNPINATLAVTEVTGTIINDDVSVATGACVHDGSGKDYPVGPGQRYPRISDVPWSELTAGDTVRIYYRPDPYREKIIISTSGTDQHPIRVCGVPGSNGERPILDGEGASNALNDAGAYGTYPPMEGLAMIMLWNRDYDLKVHNIIIEGLHIKNAKNTFRYTRIDGSQDHYENGAACIRIQAADHVIIRNNELESCGNGIFTMSQSYNEAHLTRNLLIERNYLHHHGEEGSDTRHALYIQGIKVVYQYNHFGPNNPLSGGSTLKERVADSVIRYNWFDSGSARFLDLVEVEDAAPWYIEEEYRNWASANNEPIDSERLEKVRLAEEGYRKTYVYGNFFNHIGSQTIAGSLVHYGSDNDPELSRSGTLYFYNNTVSIQQDQSDLWRFRLFYLGNRNATTPSQEVAEVFNNIVYFTPENSSEPSYFCLNETNGGTINFGINWITNTWKDSRIVDECYYGVASDAPTVNGESNLVDTLGAPPPISQETLIPLNTPLIQGVAQSTPVEYPVREQYVPHLKNRVRHTVDNLGAME